MFNIIGKLLGSEKALSTVITGVSNGLDALVYTDEEKANDGAKARSEARSMVIRWMESTQGQNLARRLIALSITGVWLLQYIVAQVCNGISVFADNAEVWNEVAKVMRSGAGDMSSPVMLILAFYFAAPHMGEITKSILAKMQNSSK